MTVIPPQQFLDILPALFVARSGGIVVGEPVHKSDLGIAGEECFYTHLFELDTLMDDLLAGNDLEVSDLIGGPPAAVGLDEADYDLSLSLAPAAAFSEHCEGLSDPAA